MKALKYSILLLLSVNFYHGVGRATLQVRFWQHSLREGIRGQTQVEGRESFGMGST